MGPQHVSDRRHDALFSRCGSCHQFVPLQSEILIDTIAQGGRGGPVDQTKQHRDRDAEQPDIEQGEPGARRPEDLRPVWRHCTIGSRRRARFR
jgi:hypothetical protein